MNISVRTIDKKLNMLRKFQKKIRTIRKTHCFEIFKNPGQNENKRNCSEKKVKNQ